MPRIKEQPSSDTFSDTRLWTRQLILEHREICSRYRIPLTPPVFEISESTHRLGSWHPLRRTIKISRQVIRDHGWVQTLNVLKHEMAHQICSELLDVHTGDHGPAFRKACDMIKVPPEHRGASGDLSGSVQPETDAGLTTAAGRKIIDKVNKLLALASSSNEHEANLAMQKAGELMRNHNLESLGQPDREAYTCLVIGTGQKQMPMYRSAICGLLAEFFHVEVICATLFDPGDSQVYKSIELFGRKENVLIAQHCYHFLENRLQMLWKGQMKSQARGNARTARNSFCLGLVQGFREKLAQQRNYCAPPAAANGRQGRPATTASKQEQTSALLVLEDRQLQDFVAQKYPRLRKVRRKGGSIYKDTYDQGVEAGRELTFHKTVTSESSGTTRLLE